MKTFNSITTFSAHTERMQQWFDTCLGQYLLAQEQQYFDSTVANIFGYNALQIGCPQFDFLRSNRIPFKFNVGMSQGVSLLASPAFLPIESGSMDLTVLPHVLEFSAHPHLILREAHRVLIPEGHIVISGFNPVSLWGAPRYFKSLKNEFPWCGDFVSLARLKDWLKLLGFEIVGGRLGCYVPPFNKEKWLKRFCFMEAAGDRWWPISGEFIFASGQASAWDANYSTSVEKSFRAKKESCQQHRNLRINKYLWINSKI